MQKTKLLDDLTGLATGLGIAAQGVRDEVEQAMRARVDAILSENGMVSREEFEAVRAMALSRRVKKMLRLRAEIRCAEKAKISALPDFPICPHFARGLNSRGQVLLALLPTQ